jgi:hypothetical protein
MTFDTYMVKVLVLVGVGLCVSLRHDRDPSSLGKI